MDDVLGANVKRLRLKRNVTQAALAEAVGIHRSTLSDVERGLAANLAVSTLARLAKALRVQPGELLTKPPRKLRRTG